MNIISKLILAVLFGGYYVSAYTTTVTTYKTTKTSTDTKTVYTSTHTSYVSSTTITTTHTSTLSFTSWTTATTYSVPTSTLTSVITSVKTQYSTPPPLLTVITSQIHSSGLVTDKVISTLYQTIASVSTWISTSTKSVDVTVTYTPPIALTTFTSSLTTTLSTTANADIPNSNAMNSQITALANSIIDKTHTLQSINDDLYPKLNNSIDLGWNSRMSRAFMKEAIINQGYLPMKNGSLYLTSGTIVNGSVVNGTDIKLTNGTILSNVVTPRNATNNILGVINAFISGMIEVVSPNNEKVYEPQQLSQLTGSGCVPIVNMPQSQQSMIFPVQSAGTMSPAFNVNSTTTSSTITMPSSTPISVSTPSVPSGSTGPTGTPVPTGTPTAPTGTPSAPSSSTPVSVSTPSAPSGSTPVPTSNK